MEKPNEEKPQVEKPEQKTEQEEGAVQTGDFSQIGLFATMFATSGAVLTTGTWKRRKRNDEE